MQYYWARIISCRSARPFKKKTDQGRTVHLLVLGGRGVYIDVHVDNRLARFCAKRSSCMIRKTNNGNVKILLRGMTLQKQH